jgi:glycoside/pentoside/hexuronide:cation symporter, GPH family
METDIDRVPWDHELFTHMPQIETAIVLPDRPGWGTEPNDMYTYFWELPRSGILMLAVAYPLGLMIGAMLAPKLHFRRGKRWALLFGTVWWAGLQVLPASLRLLGWFPENDSPLLIPLLVAMRAVQAAGAVQANVSFGSMVADVIDEHELNTGKRNAGIFFAATSFSGQAATGLGGLTAGLALDLISWPTGISIRTAADVPPEALVNLGLLYGPIIGCCSILTFWCYSHYRLTRERHEEILAALATRRTEERADSPRVEAT